MPADFDLRTFTLFSREIAREICQKTQCWRNNCCSRNDVVRMTRKKGAGSRIVLILSCSIINSFPLREVRRCIW